VIPARVLAHKTTGGNVELLFLEPADPAALAGVVVPEGASPWTCLARARRPLRAGQSVFVKAGEADLELPILTERADRDSSAPGAIVVAIPGEPYAFLERFGHVPLPPYIDRADTTDDRERYQTMFAQVPGAIASPTAGLHMTPVIADAMRARGITITSVTLHVGWGTFAPIRVGDVREHKMHRERYQISEAVIALVASGRPIVALGTTALRALESAAIGDHQLRAGAGATELFVHPGSNHRFQIVDHLITNFHLPESTLLMLVCAFAGTERVLAAYRHAVAERYRFFSYGDAMLLHRV
jgi:S-adenosylmethionine:tRNA ribosyltransferase-isomerase